MTTERGLFSYGLGLFLIVVLAGCATSSPTRMQFETGVASEAERVWPPPPDIPRYRFVGQLTGEDNFHGDRNSRDVGQKVLGWLVGLMSDRHAPVVLQRPQSGYTDPQGRVFVTDVSRAAVYVFDQVTGQLLVWEMAGPGIRFKTPLGITPGTGKRILVVDADLAQVVILNERGKPEGAFGKEILKRPVGIARDAKRGRIYVSDRQSHSIKVFDDKGKFLREIGRRGEGLGEFNAPTYMTFAHDRLYVTDTLNSRIQIFDRDGKAIRSLGRRGLFLGDMPRPKGVAADSDRNIYVVESYYDHLLIFNDKGEFLLPIGGTGSRIGEFYLPAGVWTDERDRIYVADSFNGRIMVFQYLKEVQEAG